MSDPVQNALLITAVVCAVLALVVGLWLAVQVVSLRRQRFISARVLAGVTDGASQRRSMSSRQGQQRRYTAPAVRTGVDSVTMKRALDRAASRQEKTLTTMRREIEEARAALRRDMESTRKEVQSVTSGFTKMQKQASSDTQSIQQVRADATQNLERMGGDLASLDSRLKELQKELAAVEERRGALAQEATADRKRLDTIDRGLGGVAGLVDQLRRDRDEMGTRTTALDERIAGLAGTTEKHGQRVETLESGATQLTERTSGLDAAFRQLSDNGDNLDARLKKLEHTSESALTEVALVRYDAFGDMGGRMSFSVALLDAVGDGLVITSLNGRAHSQTYAKSVTEGRGTTQLTAEEEQAVSAARGLDVAAAPEQAVRPLRQRRR